MKWRINMTPGCQFPVDCQRRGNDKRHKLCPRCAYLAEKDVRHARLARGRAIARTKDLTEADKAEICRRVSAGEPYIELAIDYLVTRGRVGQIWREFQERVSDGEKSFQR